MTEDARGFSRKALDIMAQRPLPVLLLLCLLAWLPGFFTIPPLDRDESRFAQASKQMIETGDLIDIRYSTGSRYNKPVGIYWLQSTAARIFERPPYNQIWAYRLPSLIGGIVAVFLIYWCARAFASPADALLSATLMAVCLLLSVEARIATTDAVLLACVVGAESVLLRFYLAAKDGRGHPGLAVALAGWAAVGIGILIKGPVVVAILALTVLPLSLWDRSWAWLRGIRPVYGGILVIAIVMPWMIAIAVASHGAFFQQSLGHDFAAKLMGGQESHGAPPGYYLALVTLSLWPATLLFLPGIAYGWQNRASPICRFLLVWIVANWLMFELVPTKLPHYILPVYPALVFLGVLWAQDVSHPTKWDRIVRYCAALQFLIALIILCFASVALPYKFGTGGNIAVMAGSCAGAAIGIAALILFIRRANIAAGLSAAASAIVVYATLAGGTSHDLQQLWISPRAAAMIAQARQPNNPAVILAGYAEPSLVFLLGTDTRLDNADEAVNDIRTGGLVMVEDHEGPKFRDKTKAMGVTLAPVGQLSGFDYSRGRKEHLTLYRATSRSAENPIQR